MKIIARRLTRAIEETHKYFSPGYWQELTETPANDSYVIYGGATRIQTAWGDILPWREAMGAGAFGVKTFEVMPFYYPPPQKRQPLPKLPVLSKNSS